MAGDGPGQQRPSGAAAQGPGNLPAGPGRGRPWVAGGRGTGRRYVYTYPSKAALAAVKAKVRAATRGASDQPLHILVHRLNPVLRGWTAYFRHGVSKATFNYLRAFVWRRVICWLRHKHPRASWRELRRRYLPEWWPQENDVVLFNPGAVAVTRYRYRAARIPSPWAVNA